MATLSHADAVTVLLSAVALALVLRVVYECGSATATIRRALRHPVAEAGSDTSARAAGSDARQVLPLGSLIR